MDLRVISLERYLVVDNGAVQRKARAGANRERHKGLAGWPSLRGYGSNRKVGATTRSRPGHTARAIHPRNIISTSAPMTNVPTATVTNTSRMAMTSPSWPSPIALPFYRPTAASAVDQPTSLSSPLALDCTSCFQHRISRRILPIPASLRCGPILVGPMCEGVKRLQPHTMPFFSMASVARPPHPERVCWTPLGDPWLLKKPSTLNRFGKGPRSLPENSHAYIQKFSETLC